jgi:protein farnesyltransferase subunit beta
MEGFESLRFDEEGLPTATSREQVMCEKNCCNFLRSFTCYDESSLASFRRGGLINNDKEIRLLKTKHAGYLRSFLENLPGGFVTLDASRGWIVYWIVHALYLLGELDTITDLFPSIISTLGHFQNRTGGFGGGPRQISQGAPNYAAVLSLLTIGTPEAYAVIDRAAMYQYFLSIKDAATGGFRIHIVDGEVDSRGTYTIIAIARLLNLLTPELTDGVADFLLRCQTYEGGFGGEPGNEAHGGYNFCAVAALMILRRLHEADLFALESWLLRRQTALEGGFQGRTNKLVDSCYSFWQGAGVAMVNMVQHSVHWKRLQHKHHRGASSFPSDAPSTNTTASVLMQEIDYDYDDLFDLKAYETLMTRRQAEIEALLTAKAGDAPGVVIDVDDILLLGVDAPHQVTACNGVLSCNQWALQRYITHCAQSIEQGGMRDKPGKARDFYHSCYSLSGLSVAQRSIVCGFDATVEEEGEGEEEEQSLWYVRHYQSTHVPPENDDDADVDDDEEEEEQGQEQEGNDKNNNTKKKKNQLPVLDDHFRGAVVYGDREYNLLEPTSIVYNVGLSALRKAIDHFHGASFVCDHRALVREYQSNQSS